MKEVQNKWSTLKLNDDIWAKLIYFEHNRRLAKAYVSAPVLTVDGSANGLDGFRIGLAGIANTCRSLDSAGCLNSIGQGIKLKIDSHGNILIRKVGQPIAGASHDRCCSIWVKDWPQTERRPSAGHLPLDSLAACLTRKIEHSDRSYKLFDMHKFRLRLERQRRGEPAAVDWRQCVSIIGFVRASVEANTNGRQSLLENPCWLMIINIIAIDMLKSSTCDMAAGSALSHQHSLLDQQRSKVGSKQAGAARKAQSDQRSLQRRSQSTQQLSAASSAIYTTFNSKLTGNSPVDNLSTSDYNSGSRSTSSGLRSMQSSIKMNFDQAPAEERRPHYAMHREEDRQLPHQSALVRANRTRWAAHLEQPDPYHSKQAHAECCSEKSATNEHRRSQQPLLVDHNQCQAMQDRTRGVERRQQKVSRSSIASSSSSSGCIDNDYFLSHSSMSSSSGSNERELFGQPASSSGIVGSGNTTSDEYEDSRKIKTDRTAANKGISVHSIEPDSSGHDGSCLAANKSERPSRDYLRRKVELAGYSQRAVVQCGSDCDCEYVEPPCAGCCCDCLAADRSANDITQRDHYCACPQEPVYGHLPAVSRQPNRAAKKTAAALSARKKERGASCTRVGSLLSGQCNRDDICTASVEQENKDPAKETKNGPGWLERRKYSKILPKFIFNPTGNNRRLMVQRNSSTQRISGSLDKDDKFRFTRSTQDLS